MHLWVLEKRDSWSVREWHICVYLTFDTKLAVLLYWGRVWVTPVSPSSKWHTHCLLLLCRSAEKLWTRSTRQGGAYWRHDRVALPPARGSPCSRGKKASTVRSQACPPWEDRNPKNLGLPFSLSGLPCETRWRSHGGGKLGMKLASWQHSDWRTVRARLCSWFRGPTLVGSAVCCVRTACFVQCLWDPSVH